MKVLLSVASLALPLAAVPLGAQSAATRMLHAHTPPDDTSDVDLAVGDVDGDGDLDLVTVQQVNTLLNDGLGWFEQGPIGPTVGDLDSTIELADLDGDGAADAVVSGDPPVVLLNDGAGAFALGDTLQAGSPRQQVAVADLDLDGDVDLFLAGYGDQRVLLNDGAAHFGIATPPHEDLAGAAVALLADIDGDGDADAFVGHASELWPPDSLYENDGAGGLTKLPDPLPSIMQETVGAAFADLDGDGDLDLCLKYEFGPFRSYENDGGGGFAAFGGQPADEEQLGGEIAVGDVDGDGHVDAFVAAEPWALFDDGQSRLYLGDGAGGWSEATGALPPLPREETNGALLADLDGDGDLDLATATDFHQPRIQLGDGQGGFRDVTSSLPPSAEWHHTLAVEDFDGDGFADILGIGQIPRYMRSNGDGTWTDASADIPPAVEPAQRLLTGDLDGDSDLDCVVIPSTYLTVKTQALINDGSGVFALHDIGSVLNGQDGALTDLNGDGFLDLIVVETGSASHTTLGNGDGTFSSTQYEFSALWINGVDVGDLNGDGLIDLWAGIQAKPDRIWVGDGTGAMIFWQEPAPTLGASTRDVALLDADGDGDLDAAASAFSGGLLYTRDGPSWTLTALPVTDRIEVADFDLDGDFDVLGANGSDELLLNDGTGTFTAQQLWPAGTIEDFRELRVADLDLDGDLDAVGADYQLRALWNVDRHLAWRRLPGIGKPLLLDLYGDPASPWLLAWAPLPAFVPLGALGTLRLDPAGLFPLDTGTLGGDGQATFEASLPADPGLLGVTLYAQALLGSPLVFSNLEAVPLGGF